MDGAGRRGRAAARSTEAPPTRGAAIQARIYAEDPRRDFQPSAGVLTDVVWPDGVRVEAAVDRGSEVTPYYDPLLAKIIARGDTRDRRAPGWSTRSRAVASRASRPTATS